MEEIRLGVESQKKNNDGTYQEILDKVHDIYGNFVVNSKDMVEIFDKKFFDKDIVVQLLDQEGNALKDHNGKRIESIKVENFDEHNKETYIRGMLYKLTLNPVDFIKKLSKEKELLEVLKKKGVDLGGLIKKYESEHKIAP